MIEDSHELSSHLLRRLAREFRFAEEQLVERGGESVEKRTARFLARVAESGDPGKRRRPGSYVPTRREDLAHLLGTTPETLSRTLHGLARRGLVEVDRKEVRVLDLTRLKRLAE